MVDPRLAPLSMLGAYATAAGLVSTSFCDSCPIPCRTYNASIVLDKLLYIPSESDVLDAKKADYDRANKEVGHSHQDLSTAWPPSWCCSPLEAICTNLWHCHCVAQHAVSLSCVFQSPPALRDATGWQPWCVCHVAVGCALVLLTTTCLLQRLACLVEVAIHQHSLPSPAAC